MNFDLKELLNSGLGTLQQHIPADLNWLPLASAAGVAIVGLVLLVKGARLAPLIAGLALATAGVGGGAAISDSFHTPLAPTLATTGIVGLVLGFMLFRLMQAVFVALGLVGAALGVYYVRDLSTHLQNYTSANLNGSEVTLPAAGAAAAGQSVLQRAGDVWSYLAAHVPNFSANFWTLVLATGVTGLLVGWLLPRITRAACAATFGVVLLFAGAATGLQIQSPDAFSQVQAWTQTNLGVWSWAPLAAIWVAGFIHNVRQCRPASIARPADTDHAGRPATA